jgi:hypothetical protein
MTCLLLVAAVAIVVVLAAGVMSGAGAEWDVYPGESIQGAIDGAGAGDTIYVHEGTYIENVDVNKRVTLIGDGADVVTVRAADTSDYILERSWGDGPVSKDCSDFSGVNSGCDRGRHGRSFGEFLFQHLPYKIHEFTNTRGWIVIYFALMYSIL